jgi:hypothetical protein
MSLDYISEATLTSITVLIAIGDDDLLSLELSESENDNISPSQPFVLKVLLSMYSGTLHMLSLKIEDIRCSFLAELVQAKRGISC